LDGVTDDEIRAILGFLARPLCADAQVIRDVPSDWGYAGGEVLIARRTDGAVLILYVDARTRLPAGASIYHPDGRTTRLSFERWIFEDPSTGRGPFGLSEADQRPFPRRND